MRIASETARLKSILGQLPHPRSVLELGCGDNPQALLHYTANPMTRLIGVDTDAAALRRGRSSAILFIQADIVHLPFHAQFNLIVARHPDVDRYPAAWRNALTHAPAYLNANGLLLVTTYSLPEIETIVPWMSSVGLVSFALAPARLTAPGLQGCDRFFYVWRNL